MVVSQSVSRQLHLAELFKVLGNETRYEIFKLLMAGSTCNCELAEALGIPLNLVSHHVHILLDLGLVTACRDQNDARWIFYSVDVQVLETYRQAFLALTDPAGIVDRDLTCSVRACKTK
jgi:ArsR family transcriptional regulator